MINFDAIPEELKQYPNWVCWRFEERQGKKYTKVPYNVFTGKPASVLDFTQWTTFENVKACFEQTNCYNGIGFVLTENDPFLFIDLDATDNLEQREKQQQIVNIFDSYAELSPSGQGLHIICKGNLPSGVKRSSIEMYSKTRFMTMTGNVYRNCEVKDFNAHANILYAEMKQDAAKVNYVDAPQIESDEVVYSKAANAANGEKFQDLYNGMWEKYYTSQSEADFALIDILAFYTRNRQQITRMFQMSALGVRQKAKRQDYVNYMLNRCFDNILPDIDISMLSETIQQELEKASHIEELKKEIEESSVPKPDGLLGQIADFFYNQSTRPVELVSIAAAIGLMTGICGRSYNISGTGLNMYTLLLAQTGTGKESMASGIDKLMSYVSTKVPNCEEFIGPSEIASQSAVLKYMSSKSCSFVSISGEFGKFMKLATKANAPAHTQSYLKFVLDVYNKSGQGRTLKPAIFADKEKNTATVLSPNFSILGETAPEVFYSNLNESLISDGLLPRFTILEYKGLRPERNENAANVKPSEQLVESVATLCSYSLMLNHENKVVDVNTDATAKAILDDFDKECDYHINNSTENAVRHLWNRAHLKALKLAALYAVGENMYNPCITEKHALWAKSIVLQDVRNLELKFHSGEVGGGTWEVSQMQAMKECVKFFLKEPTETHLRQTPMSLYKAISAGVLPYSYLLKRLSRKAVYTNDTYGVKNAIMRSVSNFIEMGVLQEVNKVQSKTEFDTTAKLYAITAPDYFLS